MKRVIFLDTNIFESAKFSYDSHRMTKFLEICEDKELDLYITDVVKHEVIKRIKVTIKDSLENIEKHNFSILMQSLEKANTEKISLINQLSEKLIKQFNDFIENNDVEIILSNFNQQILLDLYFNTKSPFIEQKKHEFPDAIIILTIKKWAEENNKEVLLISNDKGMIDFCKPNDIKIFNKISDVTHLLNTENPEDDLMKFYNESLEEIKSKIVTNINTVDDFILYSYDSIDEVTVEDVKISNTTINNIDIIDLRTDDEIIEIEVEICIEFSLVAFYPDEDTMHRDKEDSVYYFYLHNKADIELKEYTTCYIQIDLNKDNDLDFIDLDIQNKEFDFSLDESTIMHIEQEESFSACKW